MNQYPKQAFLFLATILALIVSPRIRAQDQTVSAMAMVDVQQTPAPAPTPKTRPAGTADIAQWRLTFSPYLWFGGVHGATGVLGHTVGVHASAGDLLSHFNIGLMGAAEARYDRFVLNGDLVWIRLSDDHALPLTPPLAVSADLKAGELIWTSKAGYRVIDSKNFKADANLGLRFWHLGQKLNLNPSPLGNSLNASQNWVDMLVGGHVQAPLGKEGKARLDLGGDVGGWGAMAQLDYQFAALLGYRISSRWTLEAGYRYLFVDYRKGSGIFNMVTTGPILGATYRFK